MFILMNNLPVFIICPQLRLACNDNKSNNVYRAALKDISLMKAIMKLSPITFWKYIKVSRYACDKKSNDMAEKAIAVLIYECMQAGLLGYKIKPMLKVVDNDI